MSDIQDGPASGNEKPGEVSLEQSKAWLDELLAAHRQGADNQTVRAMPHLCFPLVGTRSPDGAMRYVLWKPVSTLLRQVVGGVQVEEDGMCNGEIDLVYLSQAEGKLAEEIYAPVERARTQINAEPSVALASEKSLARDWNRREEDRAWAHLQKPGM